MSITINHQDGGWWDPTVTPPAQPSQNPSLGCPTSNVHGPQELTLHRPILPHSSPCCTGLAHLSFAVEVAPNPPPPTRQNPKPSALPPPVVIQPQCECRAVY